MLKRYFISLSYLGTHYHGWQTQPNALSVQSCIENALSILFKTDIKIVGCGRTDAGVHASNYMAHSDLDMDKLAFPQQQLVYKCNAILPKDIVIHYIKECSPPQHARFDALWRRYEYHLSFSKQVFKQGQLYHCPYPCLNFEKMNAAATRLLSHSNFKCFAKSGSDVSNYNCILMQAHWQQKTEHYWVFHIKANRFLRNMVRAIVGTLIEIGRDRIDLHDLEIILESGERSLSGWSVPAEGLFLAEIAYEGVE